MYIWYPPKSFQWTWNTSGVTTNKTNGRLFRGGSICVYIYIYMIRKTDILTAFQRAKETRETRVQPISNHHALEVHDLGPVGFARPSEVHSVAAFQLHFA